MQELQEGNANGLAEVTHLDDVHPALTQFALPYVGLRFLKALSKVVLRQPSPLSGSAQLFKEDPILRTINGSSYWLSPQ